MFGKKNKKALEEKEKQDAVIATSATPTNIET